MELFISVHTKKAEWLLPELQFTLITYFKKKTTTVGLFKLTTFFSSVKDQVKDK